MAVQLGARPEHSFDEPLGLLSDCHRRIEKFLDVMIRVLDRSDRGNKPLALDERDALESALRYFKNAAPRHTQDEEQSLFPRLRASDDPAAHAALARIEALEEDHRRADAMHDEVHQLCRRWLDSLAISAMEAERLNQLLHDLRDTYAGHIALEDSELFPLAARVLKDADLKAVGAEMAQRRGLDANGPMSRPKCPSKNRS
ncbi:MAG TPA: hemerythrin domain-containing protein [Tepidisphaeraceae bacterium]|nr:hemerythrin domain-containing protein [Tepidisphaeraceae bacterium]